MLQEHLTNVSFVFILVLLSYCKCFMLFGPGANLGPADGGPGGRRAGVCRGRARPQPLIPTPVCRPRVELERERERGGGQEGPAGAEIERSALVGGAKADGVGCAAGPDVRTLASPPGI